MAEEQKTPRRAEGKFSLKTLKGLLQSGVFGTSVRELDDKTKAEISAIMKKHGKGQWELTKYNRLIFGDVVCSVPFLGHGNN